MKVRLTNEHRLVCSLRTAENDGVDTANSSVETAPEILWPGGPIDVSLEAGELHVWVAALSQEAAASGPVSLSENARARQFLRASDRVHFLARRALVRRMLGRYLGLDPATLPLAVTPTGKPFIHLPGMPLHFSQSHSNNLGLFAFTRVGPVGVDVEGLRPFPEMAAIVERFFASHEIKAWRTLSAARQIQEFYETWTEKEAAVKASGEGIAGIEHAPSPLSPHRISDLHPAQQGSAQTSAWVSDVLYPTRRHLGRAVVLGEIRTIRCWRV